MKHLKLEILLNKGVNQIVLFKKEITDFFLQRLLPNWFLQKSPKSNRKLEPQGAVCLRYVSSRVSFLCLELFDKMQGQHIQSIVCDAFELKGFYGCILVMRACGRALNLKKSTKGKDVKGSLKCKSPGKALRKGTGGNNLDNEMRLWEA